MTRFSRHVAALGDVRAAVLLAALAMLAVATIGRGQDRRPAAPRVPVPDAQVDTAEIARWGDHVQHIDGAFHAGHAEGDDAQFMAGEALSIPPDDNHKWFITVIGTRGCPACARLRADIKADQEKQANLGAFITLAESDESHSSTSKGWSHYNYVLGEDKSQAPFVEAVKPKAFPTIVLQTPLNGKYGKPGVVVFQRTGYDGHPDKLAQQLADAIRAYVAKLANRTGPVQAVMPPPPRSQLETEPPSGAFAQRTPPFTPPPVGPDTTIPLTPDLVLPPQIPPAPKPDDKKPDAKPDAPKPDSIPTTPEIVVIYDKDVVVTAEQEVRIRRVLDALRTEGKIFRVRPVDFRDVPNLDVPKDQLPAVVVTENGRLRDRLSDALIPLVAPEPQPPREIGLADVPWPVLITLLTGGGIGVSGAIALGIFAVRAFRAFRASQGKPPLINQTAFDQLLAALQQLAQGPKPTEPTK